MVATRKDALVRTLGDPLELMRSLLERRHLGGELEITSPRHASDIRLVRVSQVVRRTPEETYRLATNLISAMGSALDDSQSLLFWLEARQGLVSLYYGVVQIEGDGAGQDIDLPLTQAIEVNFPGIQLEPVGDSRSKALLSRLQKRQSAAYITGIPTLRNAHEARLHEAFEGASLFEYDLVVVASPYHETEVLEAERRLGAVREAVFGLSRFSVTEGFSENYSQSYNENWSKAQSRGWSDSTTRSTGLTTSRTERDRASQAGQVLGTLVGGAAALYASGGNAIAAQMGAGLAGGVGAALFGAFSAPPESTTESSTTAQAVGTNGNETETYGRGRSEQRGGGSSRSATREVMNHQAAVIDAMLESQLARSESARALGAWQVGTFVLAKRAAETEAVANAFAGCVRGAHSHLEPVRVFGASEKTARGITKALSHGDLPLVARNSYSPMLDGEQPTTVLSSDELALWISPPGADLPGLVARPPVRFGLGLSPHSDERVPLGRLMSWNRPVAGTSVGLLPTTLSSHCLVAGTTGSGKTSTLRRLLWNLTERGLPFMLLEPAKSEYDQLFELLAEHGAKPIRLGFRGQPLRINPFRAPVGTEMEGHIDAIKILLRSGFDMQESLPQILERVVFRLYEAYGWPELCGVVTAESSFPSFDKVRVPETTFSRAKGHQVPTDLIAEVVRELGYEPRIQASLIAATRVRLESFTKGLKGRIFSEDTFDVSDLLTRPVFVNVSHIKDPDVRRFLLGAILLRVAEYRETEGASRRELKHVLLLEEAHNLVEAPTADNAAAGLLRESNRLFANALAELRAYGQGIVVADQSPALLDRSVIRNTNTKIVHRLLFEEDCQMIGDAMGLAPEAREQLRYLNPGECVLHSPEQPEAIAMIVDEWRIE